MGKARSKCRMDCGRESRKPDNLCEPCWRKAGKPTAEQVAEQRAYDRLRAEGVAPVGKSNGLLDDEAETDVGAMEALWDQKGEAKTRRQDSFAVLYRANPQKFYETLSRLRGSSTAEPSPGATDSTNSSTASWDGTGRCPACDRPPDRYPADAGMERIEELLDADFAETGRMDRHREKVLSFMDREGLT